MPELSNAMDLNTCFLHLLAVSVVSTHSFFTFNSSKAICQTCLNNNCVIIEPIRCKYYAIATSVQRRDLDEEKLREDQKIRSSVDEILFDLIGNTSSEYECVPYISQYTDCTKENICLGCQNCACNEDGRWSCNTVQKCQASTALQIDHRVLVSVMEKLLEKKTKGRLGKSRMIRAVPTLPSESNARNFENTSEWLYGVRSHNFESQHREEKGFTLTDTPVALTAEAKPITDTDSLAFEDVLNGIAISSKNVTRRKPPLDMNHNETIFDLDFLIFDDEENTTYNFNSTDISPSVFDIINDISHVTEKTDATTNVIIDLLETAKNAMLYPQNTTDFENYIDSGANIPDSNYLDNNSVIIMKRDTKSDFQSTALVNSTSQPMCKNTTKCKCCNGTLSNPLFRLINAIEKEINQLQAIKENLVELHKSNNTPQLPIKDNTTDSKLEASSFEEIFDTQNQNNNPLNGYIIKLKRDIFEVIRDIMLVRKHEGSTRLPDDLKLLIHAMKHYINYHNVHKDTACSHKQSMTFRRTDTNTRISETPKDNIWKILSIIDKQILISNALDALSNTSKRVILRLIGDYFEEDRSDNKLNTNTLSSNVIDDLNSVEKQMMELARNLEKYETFEELYLKKIIHFIIGQYITKLQNLLRLIRVSHNRRSEQQLVLTTDAVNKIASGLQEINTKIKTLLKLNKEMKPKAKIQKPTTVGEGLKDNLQNFSQVIDVKRIKEDNETKKKKSFMKKIVDLLNHSKKEIKDLLRKKVSKTEIIKQIAKNKLSELQRKKYFQYENTMKKWQNNLDVKPKVKREAIFNNRFQGRIKNIIPQYLRGKVDTKFIKDKHDKKPRNIHIKPHSKRTQVNQS